MKIFILLVLFVNYIFALPNWYLHIPTKHSYEIIGYGSGKTINKAKENARIDISKQIYTNIIGISQKTAIKKDNTSYYKFERKVVEQTDVIINDTNILKYFEDKINHKFYIAVSYFNLPYEKRFAKKLNIHKCHNEIQNKYLAKTLLLQKINQELNCQLDIKLVNQNSRWYLSYKDTLEILSNYDFEQLFISVKNNKIDFVSSSDKLKDKQEFFFNIKSKKDGFISLVVVYENGTVAVIKANKKIKKMTTNQIPSKKSLKYLRAGLLKENTPTYDLYFLIYSNNKIDFSRFVDVNENIITDKKNYKFDEFLTFIDDFDFSSKLIKTYP